MAAEINPEIKVGTKGEIGHSGTLIFNGIIQNEEYNRDLSGKLGLKIFDKMRRSDGTVSAALLVCKLPIQAAEWTVEPASDSAEDIKIADFVRQNLFNGEIAFTEVLREILGFFDFGHSIFEEVWDPDYIYEGKNYIGLKKLASRKPTTIFSWDMRSTGMPGVTQQLLGLSGGTAEIPMDKLAVFTLNKEGDNYEGISLLRPAYKHWYIIDSLYKIDAIKHERQALGIIDITVPDGASVQDQDQAVEAARSARANEEAFIKHGKDWIIQFMDMKAGTLSDPMGTIAHHDAKIVKAVLAQFLNFGADKSGGNKALSADHSRLFEQSLEAAAKLVASVMNKQVIRRLVDINFTTKNYPTLEFGKIGDENITELADAVQKLVTAKALTPDADMEQTLRSTLHLPDLPEDYAKDYANRPGANVPAPAPALPDPNAPKPTDPGGGGGNGNGDTNLNADDALRQAQRARAALIAATEANYARV